MFGFCEDYRAGYIKREHLLKVGKELAADVYKFGMINKLFTENNARVLFESESNE